MDDYIEDIKKLDEILKKENENQNDLQKEFDEFLNYDVSDEDDEPLEGFETETSINFEDIDINKIDEVASNYYNIDNTTFHSDLNLVRRYLTKDEVKIINLCKDPGLKKIMVLNRIKHLQLQNVHAKLYETLKNCSVSIKDIEEKIKEFCKSQQCLRSIIPRLGHPYFKTKDSNACMPNSDTYKKRKNKEISVDYLPRAVRWTLDDQIALRSSVIFNYHNACIDRLEHALKYLYAVRKVSTDKDTSEQVTLDIKEKEAELNKLKDCVNPNPPPLVCSEDLNWVLISNDDLKGRHSSFCCQAFWKIYLHPLLNKSNWTEDENENILKLAEKYQYQNWEAVASELHNNRGGFSVCVHYYTKLNDRFKKERFEPDEDAFLLEVVDTCKIGNYIPWTKVASYFSDSRSKTQIYHRYKYHLMYNNIQKGLFSEAEDVLLLCLVEKFGKDFHKCYQYMPNRSPLQLSHRYNNYLKCETLNFGNWTVAEDRKILDYVGKHGPREWGSLVGVLRRNRAHIRQRYVVLEKWLTNNPGKNLDEMFRKKQNYKQSGDFKTIRNTANIFKGLDYIPSLNLIKVHLQLVDKKIVLKAEKKPKNNFIDAELINFFQSTCRIKTEKIVTEDSLQDTLNSVKMILALMDVTLEIPDDNSLRSNILLDQVDIEILSLLKENTAVEISDTACSESRSAITLSDSSPCNQQTQINYLNVTNHSKAPSISFIDMPDFSLVPPNINTLVGLRSLLITFDSFKKRILNSDKETALNEAKCKIVWRTQQNYLQFNDQMRSEITEDRKLFEKRFTVLFRWPALMSILEPREKLNLLNAEPVLDETEKLTPKVGRPRKNLTKINLMREAKKKKALEKLNNKESSIQASVNSNETEPVSVRPSYVYVHTVQTKDVPHHVNTFVSDGNGGKVSVNRLVSDAVKETTFHYGLSTASTLLNENLVNPSETPNSAYVHTVQTNDVLQDGGKTVKTRNVKVKRLVSGADKKFTIRHQISTAVSSLNKNQCESLKEPASTDVTISEESTSSNKLKRTFEIDVKDKNVIILNGSIIRQCAAPNIKIEHKVNVLKVEDIASTDNLETNANKSKRPLDDNFCDNSSKKCKVETIVMDEMCD